MRLRFLTIAAAFATTVVAQSGDELVLARVGNRSVTVGELRQLVVAQRRTGDTARVLDSFTAEGRRHVLDQLIATELLATGAKDRGLDREPAVQRAIAHAVDRVLADELVRSESAALDLSDASLRRQYDEHLANYSSGIRMRARHIVVATDSEAQAVVAALAAGRDFGDIAAERNTDSSRARRGELGWVPRGMMVRPFEDALFALRAGERSGIVRTTFGYHVVEAEAIDPGAPQPFDLVKEQIRQQLVAARVDALKAAIAATHAVSIDESALRLVQ